MLLEKITDSYIKHSGPERLARNYRATNYRLLEARANVLFRELVIYAAKFSPFYRRKFEEFKINPYQVKHPLDLGDFYTTPEDIVRNPKEFICQPPYIVFESSGTTGKNKEIYYSLKELKDIGRFVAAGFHMWGIDRNDRIANAFDFSIWIPGRIFQEGLDAANIFNLNFSKVDPQEVYNRLGNYKFNVILGEPTWLIRLTEIAEKKGAFPLKLMIGSAEGMPQAARPWIKEIWQGAGVIMAYSSVESALALGVEVDTKCDAYHIDDVNFYYEIINKDADGFGEVTYSTLTRRTMPLIRYRNRDISSLNERVCACGLKTKMLSRIRGRIDEMIIASGGNLYPLMFEKILDDIEGITKDWQVVFKLNGYREVMEINVEASSKFDSLKEKVFNNMKTYYPDLWKNYNIGIFDIDFIWNTPGELRKNKRKLRRLVDERCKAL
ncbi:MAG: hypothetical protein AB1755_06305 [Candidatus Omnitrophota bacterium]